MGEGFNFLDRKQSYSRTCGHNNVILAEVIDGDSVGGVLVLFAH